MGKKLVIRGANFLENAAFYGNEYVYENNSFEWGKGGIASAGQSSGSTNATMSMIGLPLEYASSSKTFVAANGYGIKALLTSNVASPSVSSQYEYTQYDTLLEDITIQQGKYFQLAVTKIDGTNADITEGAGALLIQRRVIPE